MAKNNKRLIIFVPNTEKLPEPSFFVSLFLENRTRIYMVFNCILPLNSVVPVITITCHCPFFLVHYSYVLRYLDPTVHVSFTHQVMLHIFVSVVYCFWLFMTIHIIALPLWLIFEAEELEPFIYFTWAYFFQTKLSN